MKRLESPRKNSSDSLYLDDKHLLVAVTNGDLAAFEAIHRKHFSKLMKFATRITGNHEAAEEVINDTFMVVWRTASHFQGRSKATTWMFGIAYRLAIKKKQKLGRLKNDICLDECVIRDTANTMETVLFRRDVDDALGKLKPELRAVVELTYFSGYIYSEIAELLGCPVGTVKTRMMTARQHLRRLLSEEPARMPALAAA
ncbi:RNA polymerase sigma-70 factor (ECF subfamily) [Labrenzia sp. EL_195]|nr:RNA polymerase sigma-70 factor (ECF subfamily) [Labrenzia sp. EL_195]